MRGRREGGRGEGGGKEGGREAEWLRGCERWEGSEGWQTNRRTNRACITLSWASLAAFLMASCALAPCGTAARRESKKLPMACGDEQDDQMRHATDAVIPLAALI